ncbi:MAG TPA: ABC transporter permease [Marmoricola sp.]|jgi:hypothetical protein|nr:ABC transporter permease [Marmoricola sp.]
MSTGTSTLERTAPATRTGAPPEPIPMSRIITVEISKMFDTRSGFWLLAGVGIAASIATIATIVFSPHDDLGYGNFAGAVGFPMTVILPMIAILAVTSEWSQRSGLTTFTLIPHRSRVIVGKLGATLAVGVVSIIIAFTVGALGNVIGSSLVGVPIRWDMSPGLVAQIFLADGLTMLMGFTLGILIRSSPGAIVAYFVYALVLPAALGALASFQHWFSVHQGWFDFNYSVGELYDNGVGGKDWAHLAASGSYWLVIPLMVGLWTVTRSEVK